MSESQTKPSLRWQTKRLTLPNASIPARPGLYAIGHEDEKACLGLESGRVYVYIGKTKNLRQRLGQHSQLTETKLGLRKYLQNNASKVRCWYAVADVTPKQLADMELQLIQHFVPKYNDVGKPKSREES